jgi:hypothetical protein
MLLGLSLKTKMFCNLCMCISFADLTVETPLLRADYIELFVPEAFLTVLQLRELVT